MNKYEKNIFSKIHKLPECKFDEATDAVQRDGSEVRDKLLEEIKQLKYKLKCAEDTIKDIHKGQQSGCCAVPPAMECERYLSAFTDYFN